MIEDSRIVIDWMQGLPVPQVAMACKCIRVCKATECQCVANAFECLQAWKNHLCDNMIDNDFEGSVDDTADEVIMTTTKVHKKIKMSIVYTILMSADC